MGTDSINKSLHGEQEGAVPSDIGVARTVLAIESEGLRKLAVSLDQRFVAAVDTLFRAEGRVVVSGMGKSGHVARKIAATMASTGTPAFYLHPAEASHGDLGMIDRDDDVVLLLSNSGETPELAAVVSHCKRFGRPLVAIVGKAHSTLADAATTALVIPSTPEAGPIGLAPTTSTTVMIALGDCLALALMRRRGFTADDFRQLHPGGRIGSSLIRVTDIMHTGDALPLVDSDAVVSDALLIMTAKAFGCVGVVSDGRLVGVITDGDLRRHMNGALLAKLVVDIMTPTPKTIMPQALAVEALGMMNKNSITSLFACENGEVKGILHIHDCLRVGLV